MNRSCCERMNVVRNIRLIAQMSINEMSRRKILPILGIMTLGFFVLFDFVIGGQSSAAVPGNPLSNLATVVGDKVMAAFFVNLFIGFMAIFIVSGAITPEVDNGTLLVILARPLKRWQIIAGKWLAVLVMQVVMIPILVIVTSIIVHAYFPHQSIPLPALMGTILSFLEEGWILSLLALLGSVFLSQVANGIMIGLAFIINFIVGSMAQLVHHSLILQIVSPTLSLLMPTNELYRRALFEWSGGISNPFLLSALGPFGVTHPPAGSIAIYAIIYAGIVFAITCRSFARLDV